MLEKTCTLCKESKPLSDFRIRTRKIPRPRSHCKPCEAQAQRERHQRPETKARRRKVRRQWERKNPEKCRRMVLRRAFRSKGCREEELEAQIDRYLETTKCDICGMEPAKQKGRWDSLHIDHCHDSGVIRGFLCGECNFGLGKFRDRPDLLLAAADYLMRHADPHDTK